MPGHINTVQLQQTSYRVPLLGVSRSSEAHPTLHGSYHLLGTLQISFASHKYLGEGSGVRPIKMNLFATLEAKDEGA